MTTLKVGPELVEAITLAMEANLAVLLVGQTGIGKSEILQQVAAARDMEFVVRDLSLMEGPDLAGLPVPRDGRMHYLPPAFLPEPETTGLLVFEELNRAPRHVRTPCLQLMTTRHLNDYALPPGWCLAAAINPYGEDYDVDMLDPALETRFVIYNVVADVRNWLKWAEEHGVHEAVRRYVKHAPKIFESTRSNPRSWSWVSDVVHAHERSGKKCSIGAVLATVAGLVGSELAVAFLKTYTASAACDVPDVQEVLGSYSKIRRRVRKAARDGDDSFLASLCHGVRLFLQEPANEEKVIADKAARDNLRRLAEDVPAEYRRKLKEAHPWTATPRKKKTRKPSRPGSSRSRRGGSSRATR